MISFMARPRLSTLYRRPLSARLLLTLCCIAASMLSACAHSVRLTRDQRSTLRSVSVRTEVKMPAGMFYSGQKDALVQGMLGPVVGGVVGSKIADKAETALLRVMHESGIDVGQLAREQFQSALDGSRLFAAVTSESSDAEFVLTVNLYGLAQKGAFASELRPMLNITGTLVRPDGTVLWKDSAYVTNMSGETHGSTLKEYLEDPERLRQAFTDASNLVARDLVAEMAGN
ncbi:MAG: hypothetical protein QM778_05810 [Myxococcales bacterium]